MRILILCALVLTIMACQSDTNAVAEEKTETKAPNNEAIEKVKSLISKARENPQDHEGNAKLLGEAAQASLSMNLAGQALGYLQEALRNHPTASSTPDNVLSMASIFGENMKNTSTATTLYQAFGKAFPTHAKAAEVKAKIPADAKAVEERIAALGTQMYNEETRKIDFQVAGNYITDSELYAMLLPNEARSPEFLFKAAETARSIRQFPKAIDIYDWIYNKYPTYEKAPQALFLKGFTMDNDMKQKDQAKVIYETFLEKYPKDDFADDTKFLLDNLNTPDDEIIKSFEKK